MQQKQVSVELGKGEQATGELFVDTQPRGTDLRRPSHRDDELDQAVDG